MPVRKTRSGRKSSGAATDVPVLGAKRTTRKTAKPKTKPIKKTPVIESEDDTTIEGIDDEQYTQSKPGKRTPRSQGKPQSSAKKKKKTPKTKAPKANTPKRKTPKAKKAAEEQEDYEEDSKIVNPLFRVIKGSHNEYKKGVDAWIKLYNDDSEEAKVQLIAALVHTSGCKVSVDAEMFEDVTEACGQLTQHFNEDSGEYPLQGRDKKSFQDKLSRFVEIFVQQTQNECLFDEDLLDTIINWLTPLSSSSVRAFRHTSTLIALTLGTSLISVATSLEESIENTEVQLATEKKKKGKASQRKIDTMEEQIKESEEKVEIVDALLENEIFHGIAIHRYRDTFNEIRLLTLTELGKWINLRSSKMLDDKYLKYLGWCLNDKDGGVRGAVLSALATLYSNEDDDERFQKLAMFTNRFKTRMASMCEDIDDKVVVKAIKLMTLLSNAPESVVEEDQVDSLCEMIYSNNAAVRSAVGEFVSRLLIDQELSPILEKLDEDQSNVLVLKQMARLCKETGESMLDNKEMYFVDGLWEVVPQLQSWESYLKLCLQDNNVDEENDDPEDTELTSGEESSILAILLASARHATGTSPLSSTKRLTTTETKRRSDAGADVTTTFMKYMPDLFKKFGADPDKAHALIGLLQCFQLSFYPELRGMKQFEQTLEAISDVLQKHSGEDLLLEASDLLNEWCSCDLALQTKAENERSSLIDTLYERLKKSLKRGVPEAEVNDDGTLDDASYVLKMTLTRLTALARHTEVPDELWKLTNSVIVEAESDDVNEQVLKAALRLAFSMIVWDIRELDRDSPDEANVDQIYEHSTTFIKQCDGLLSAGTKIVQYTAYTCLMDLAVLLSPTMAKDNKDLTRITLRMDSDQQQRCVQFCIDTMFEDNPEEHEKNIEDPLKAQKQEEQDARKDAVFIGLCKLMNFGLLHPFHLVEFIPHYFHNKRVGEILRFVIGQIRDNDEFLCTEIILKSLQKMLETVKEDPEYLESAKEIAHRITLTYGVSTSVKYRKSLIRLHRKGIMLALQTNDDQEYPNLQLLELLKEFSMKVTQQDKVALAKFLEEKTDGMYLSTEHITLHLTLYKNSLTKSTGRTPATRGRPSSSKKRASSSRSSKTRKRLNLSPGTADDQEESLVNWGALDATNNDDDDDDDKGDSDVSRPSSMEPKATPLRQRRSTRRKAVEPISPDSSDNDQDDDEEEDEDLGGLTEDIQSSPPDQVFHIRKRNKRK